jgi:hypothetical protein
MCLAGFSQKVGTMKAHFGKEMPPQVSVGAFLVVLGRIELKITDGKQPQINPRNFRKHNILQKYLRIRK